MVRAPLQDKMLGMILLGAYGDALGAPHEHTGLAGRPADPETARRLAPARDYHPPGRPGDPWWVWADGDDLDPDARGVPTDDSSYRLMILHEWLAEQPGNPAEHAFLDWMRRRADEPAPRDGWPVRRREQIRAWIDMMRDAAVWTRALADAGDDAQPARERFAPSPHNRFYRPGVPVVFGVFLYAELGALHAGRTCADVFEHFAAFSRLDQAYAAPAAGLVAALVAEAITAPPTSEGFADWFLSRPRELIAAAPHGERATIAAALDEGRRVGLDARDLPGAAFTEALAERIYQPRKHQLAHDFANFDPALFLAMMTAAVAWAGDDPIAALRALARSPGDADTMPSFLGTIAGARLGHAGLRELSATLADDLAAQRTTIEGLFAIDLGDRAARFAAIAQRFGDLDTGDP
jgi:hypothetical protein